MTDPDTAAIETRGSSESAPRSVLACRDLRKSFGPTVALRGVDLDVRPGEVLAVTGESGSGKSTLLLCLGGILPADGGSVTFGGRELGAMSDAERTALRRREFGFVFQLGYLVPDLPAVLNVALPLMLNGADRRRAEREALELLERVGVAEVAGRRPAEMSVGQAQRVAVARALITSPSLVFADEPTGALDSRNAAKVLDLLVAGVRDRGTTLVLVTHSAAIAEVADRRVVLRDGAIIG